MMNKSSILIIDDEQVICYGCTQTLVQMGMNVDCAQNGIIGLAKLQDHPYDVVLLDLKMPQINGLQVLDAIRRMDQHIMTVIITGYATIETAVECVKRGAFDYLAKPFTPDELRGVVRKALENKKALLNLDG